MITVVDCGVKSLICYVPTLGTYDTSATTAWYTLNPIIVINNRPPIIQDVFI